MWPQTFQGPKSPLCSALLWSYRLLILHKIALQSHPKWTFMFWSLPGLDPFLFMLQLLLPAPTNLVSYAGFISKLLITALPGH